MSEQPWNQTASDAFGARMLGVLNEASVALMASIGHQVGLFDTLANKPNLTCQQIAQAARLNERYVREWLAAMVTGQVLRYDSQAKTYTLPAEHAAWLTRAAGPNNLATIMQAIPLLAQVEAPLIECFRSGGGVPYAAYPRFQQLMAEGSARGYDKALISEMLPVVPGLIARLQTGIQVLDIGCGAGHAINLMAKAFPNSHFTGYDFSQAGIATARAEAMQLQLRNAHFEACDAAQLSETDQYDLITAFDAIHDQVYPAQVLRNIAAALRPDGVFLMVDVRASSQLEDNMQLPLATHMYTISCMHCMTVSLAHGGGGLGAMWGEQVACQMLADAGFTHVEVKQIQTDTGNNYYIATKN